MNLADLRKRSGRAPRPRVLVMNHSAVPAGVSGITRHAEMCARLSHWDHLIVAGDLNRFTGARERRQAGFEPVHLSRYESNGIRRVMSWVEFAVKAFWRALFVGRVDVVFASSPHLLTLVAGWAVSLCKRAPLVVEVRDLWPRVLVDMGHLTERSLVYRVLSILESFVYRRARRVVVLAPGVLKELRAKSVPETKLVYIPNGADSADFASDIDREDVREKHGFSGVTGIYAGAHGPANGLSLLIDAMKEIDSQNVTVVLVGGGVEKPELQAAASREGLENVVFLEPVSKSEIPDLFKAADFGIHVLADVELFRNGVSPNKLFDYMAAGLPVLTNAPGLCTEIVGQAECGVAVEPRGLASGIDQMVAKVRNGQAAVQGESGRGWMDSNQSRSAMAKRFEDLLDELR